MKNILTNSLCVALLICVGLGCGRFGLSPDGASDDGGAAYTVLSRFELEKAQEAILKKIGNEGKIARVLIIEESLKVSVKNSENPLLEDSYVFDANGLKADKLGKYTGRISSERIISIGDIDLLRTLVFIEKTKQLIDLPDGEAFYISIYRSDSDNDKDYQTIWHVAVKDGSGGGFALFDNDGNELKGVRDGKDVFEADRPAPATPVQTGEDTPRPAEIPKRIPHGVVNGRAISLPKPEYPAAARAANVKGFVNVAVVIGVKGDVISAEAVSGDQLLREAAVSAARRAEFKPTSVSGQPVEVSGVIVYDFK